MTSSPLVSSVVFSLTFLHIKAGRVVRSGVLLPLLVPTVLGHVVEVVATHDNGPLHLGGNTHGPGKKYTRNEWGSHIFSTRFECKFSNLKILPLMLTFPVKGHFLSMYVPLMASLGVTKPRPTLLYQRGLTEKTHSKRVGKM